MLGMHCATGGSYNPLDLRYGGGIRRVRRAARGLAAPQSQRDRCAALVGPMVRYADAKLSWNFWMRIYGGDPDRRDN